MRSVPTDVAEPQVQVVRFNPHDRRHFIGGSDARIIMGDDRDDLIRLWREKRGEIEPQDFSQNLIVQLGSVTEELNRTWYERTTAQTIKDIQKRIRHPIHKWMAATLDGIVEQSGAIFEAKFMLPWAFTEEAAADKHMAQLQHNMWVTASRSAVLSITPAAASGSRSRSMPTRSISTFCSPRKGSSGVVCRAARLLPCSTSKLHARDSRPSRSST